MRRVRFGCLITRRPRDGHFVPDDVAAGAALSPSVNVRGATDGWAGLTKWKRDSMLAEYGESYYHVEHGGNEPLGKLLKVYGRYNMGHMVS